MGAGLGSLIAQAFGGLSSMASAQANYRNAMSMMEYQNEWNSPKSQLERAKAAGLNPNAVAQTIAGSPGFGNMAAADAASLPKAVPDLGSMIGNSVNSALNAEFIKANTRNTNEDTRGKELDNDLKDATFDTRVQQAEDEGIITHAQAENAKLFAEKYPELLDLSLEQAKEDLNKTREEIKKIQKDIEVSDQNIAESKKRIDKLEQDIRTSKSQEAKNYAEIELTKEKTKLAQLENENQELKNRNLELSGDESGWKAQYFALEKEQGKEAADKWLSENMEVTEKVVKNTSKASAEGQNEAYDETVEGTEKRQLEKEMNDKLAEQDEIIRKAEEALKNNPGPMKSRYEDNIKWAKSKKEEIRKDYSKRIAEVDKGRKNSYGVNLAGYGINFTN